LLEKIKEKVTLLNCIVNAWGKDGAISRVPGSENGGHLAERPALTAFTHGGLTGPGRRKEKKKNLIIRKERVDDPKKKKRRKPRRGRGAGEARASNACNGDSKMGTSPPQDATESYAAIHAAAGDELFRRTAQDEKGEGKFKIFRGQEKSMVGAAPRDRSKRGFKKDFYLPRGVPKGKKTTKRPAGDTGEACVRKCDRKSTSTKAKTRLMGGSTAGAHFYPGKTPRQKKKNSAGERRDKFYKLVRIRARTGPSPPQGYAWLSVQDKYIFLF